MLLSLLMLLSSGPLRTPEVNPAADPDPPIHVWLNSDGNYALGDHAKVYVRAAQDGYLIVLHAAPDGRVRVLFPIDPRDDQHVQAHKKYEVKGRGGHEAFMVADTTGHGTLLAALAKEPFRLDEFEQNGRWDYQALSERAAASDPEAGLMSLIQRMQPTEAHYEYDVATYVAGVPRYAGYPYPYWGYGPRAGLGFWFGPPYAFRWGYGYRWGGWRW
jgi:hypothetical protein